MGEPPSSCLLRLPEDALIRVIARVPVQWHESLGQACKTTRSLLRLPSFRAERLASGYAERFMLIAGGAVERRCSAEVSLCRLDGTRLSRHVRCKLPAARRAAAAAGNVVVGGFLADGRLTATVVRVSPFGSSPLPPMTAPRAGLACGRVQGALVAAGGLANAAGLSDVTATAEALVDNVWTPVPPLPRATCFCASGVLRSDGRDFLVVAGGETNHEMLKCVQVFDGINWTLRAPLPIPISGAASAVWRNTLYVFGGWSYPLAVVGPSFATFAYDFDTDKWRKGPCLPMCASINAPAAAVASGVVLVASSTSILLLSGPPGHETFRFLDTANDGDALYIAQAAVASIVL